jgi:hypothetical protein
VRSYVSARCVRSFHLEGTDGLQPCNSPTRSLLVLHGDSKLRPTALVPLHMKNQTTELRIKNSPVNLHLLGLIRKLVLLCEAITHWSAPEGDNHPKVLGQLCDSI